MSETSQIKLPPPLVTVCIPCYNYANVVGRAIKSVQEQTLSNFECFVVDNNSTDNSREAILEAIKDDARFSYLLCKEQGVAHTRNRGVFSGNAPFVMCLDADDALDPQFLEACVVELEKDPSLGIAYTGLYYIRPDGKHGLSTWPTQYNYDEFLKGLNQIPTCNVSRRVIWERLGGQRQRYAPQGAGEEDAEMWLRAGALGWKAKKVTDAGLFIYSWMSGRVSGNKEHKTVDYMAWHPWVKDKKYPFASMAKPVKYSHPVRQYDEPSVSVIIPVGEGHETDVINALDSLEAQTFRGWEAILVWDSPVESSIYNIRKMFPFVRGIHTGGNKGAGYSRNLGAKKARADLLLFLDADDWLDPQAIQKMLDAYAGNNAIVYSDYVGKSFIDEDLRKKFGERVLDYDPKDGYAIVKYNAAEYDYDKAVRQPYPDENGYPFHWNLITSLTPRAWHEEIGGFDENMKSWEDWDYWIRMAKAGKPFTHIPEILVVYRFYTGNRREIGLQNMGDLIQYLQKKYEGIKIMPCRSCGKKLYQDTNSNPPNMPMTAEQQLGRTAQLRDDDFVLILYAHPNRGSHRVVGPTTGIDYGYRSGGGVEKFLVHVADIASMPDAFRVVEEAPITAPQEAPQAEPPPPAPIVVPKAEKLEEPRPLQAPANTQDELIRRKAFDLQLLPGIDTLKAQELNAMGVHGPGDFSKITDEQLLEIKGFGPARVAALRKYIADLLEKEKVAETA